MKAHIYCEQTDYGTKPFMTLDMARQDDIAKLLSIIHGKAIAHVTEPPILFYRYVGGMSVGFSDE